MGLAERFAREDAEAEIADALAAVIGDEVAHEVIAYRKRMGKRFHLTPRAARMLAKKLAACPDPVGAADEMMLRGWQSVEYDWLPAHRRQKAHQPTGIMGAAYDLMENGYGSRNAGDNLALEFTSSVARH